MSPHHLRHIDITLPPPKIQPNLHCITAVCAPAIFIPIYSSLFSCSAPETPNAPQYPCICVATRRAVVGIAGSDFAAPPFPVESPYNWLAHGDSNALVAASSTAMRYDSRSAHHFCFSSVDDLPISTKSTLVTESHDTEIARFILHPTGIARWIRWRA